MRWVLVVGGVVVIGSLAAVTCLPIKKVQRLQVCLYCGESKQVTVNFGSRRLTFRSTDFKSWFDRRVGLAHEHRWEEERTSPVVAENLWGKRWEIEKAHRQPGIETEYYFAGRCLLRLEPLKLDVELWRELTHSDEARAEQARTLAWELSVDGPDPQVTYQWSLAKQYLENRAAWKDGFKTYWGDVSEK